MRDQEIKNIATPSREILQEIKTLWEASEQACAVAFPSKNGAEFFLSMWQVIQDTFGAWTWARLFDTWRKANIGMMQDNPLSEDPAKRVLHWRNIRERILRVPIDPKTVLPMPKTEMEKERDMIRDKRSQMTREELLSHDIGILNDAPRESLDIVLSGSPTEIFAAMMDEFSLEERDMLKLDVWSGWVAYLRNDVKVPQSTIDALNEDKDRMEKSLEIAKSTLRTRGEYKREMEPEVRQKVIGRRCIFHLYQQQARKYFIPNVE